MSYNRTIPHTRSDRVTRLNSSTGQDHLNSPIGEGAAGEDTVLEEQEPGVYRSPRQQAGNGQVECRGGYSMIVPNESRRSQLQRMANKELEELKRWKENNRPGPINLIPVQLGGVTSESEARRLQQINLQGSKFQQRAKKQEYDRKRKEAQELEYQKKKEIQREKANKLAAKQRQEEEQRKAQFQAEHYQTNQQFLQRIETSNRTNGHSPELPSCTVQTAAWNEFAVENESRLETERQNRLQDDHRRKNKAFLDNLERSQNVSKHLPSFCPPVCDESFEAGTPHTAPELTSSECFSKSEQYASGTTINDNFFCGDSPEGTDYDWNLMKLQSCFPGYEMTVLEELLLQCGGDYERLIQLLQ